MLAGCAGDDRDGMTTSPPPPGLFGELGGVGPDSGGDRSGQIDDGPASSTANPPPEEAEIYTGSGRFAREARGRTAVTERDGDFTMNFVDADVRRVVEAVLGEALELNYIVDPEVEGRITARTMRPLTEDRILPALEDILAMHGLALVASDDLYRVLPIEAARTMAPVLGGVEAHQRGFAVHVIPLHYASADNLLDTLEPFVAPGRGLQVDDARNLLLFRGPANEARDIAAMADMFDVDWMEGMSFALLPLTTADAADVVIELEAIFGLDNELSSPLEGAIRFMPIERMNAVLAISEQPAYLRRAQDWVTRLDRGGGSEDQRQLYVYHLKNARASEVAAVLGQLFQVSVVDQQQSQGGGTVAPGRQSGTLSGGGASGSGGRSGSGGSGSGGGSAGGGASSGSASQPAGGAGAGLAAGRARLGGGRTAAGGLTGGLDSLGPQQGGLRIIADERNDALLIMATTREYRMIESTLDRLDIAPLQVLVEATIAEVSLNDRLEHGLRYFFDVGDADTTNELTFSDAADGRVAASFPGFSYFFQGQDVSVALNALNDITDVTVISSPMLMALDNQTARLQVGDQVPVPSAQSVSTQDPNAPIVNSIDFQDTGVILEITPHVNASGMVVLDVLQEVSDVVETTSSGIDAPTIQQRQIQSSVAVRTGETIALGGLIRDSNTLSRSGIPLLMDIPWLGRLFENRTRTNDRTELLVLLTPQVVRNSGEAREVTRELRRRLQGISRMRERYDLDEDGEPIAPPAPEETGGDADGGS